MGVRTGAIILDFSKEFNSNQQQRLLTKIVATGVELKVIMWVKEFVLGRSEGVGADGQLSEEFCII